MRTFAGLVIYIVGLFLVLLVEIAVPPIHSLQGARLFFVPLIFCYAAMCLPFPAMMFAAVLTGLALDLNYLNVTAGQVEIGLGWSIFYFVSLGCVAQGLQPSMNRGRWWSLIPLAAVGTSAYLILQFAMISMRREGLVWDSAVLWRVIAPGLLAALLAPLLHQAAQFGARFLPEAPRPRFVER
ncbi:MAG: hypothetical protein SFU53_09405 [Terrimicrobiaceae bacterium]|nr:hypothetical protein [Terrimicrobiaceae bacterium]